MVEEDTGSWHGVAPSHYGQKFIAAKEGMWKGGIKALTFKARALPARALGLRARTRHPPRRRHHACHATARPNERRAATRRRRVGYGRNKSLRARSGC